MQRTDIDPHVSEHCADLSTSHECVYDAPSGKICTERVCRRSILKHHALNHRETQSDSVITCAQQSYHFMMISRTQSRLQAACMRVLAVDLLPPCNCPKAPQRSQACATCRELQVARHGLPQHVCTVYKSCVTVCACTIAWTLRAYLHSLSHGTQSHLDQHRQIPAPEHNTTHRTYMHICNH